MATLSVVSFPGEAGGLLSNVNRWRGQLQLDPMTEEALEKVVKMEYLGDHDIKWVRLSTSVESLEKKRSSTFVVAIFEHAGESWFLKMVSDRRGADYFQTQFRDWVKTIRHRHL